MPDWVIEHGIGETRLARLETGRIVEARILRDGIIPAGTVLPARLLSTGRGATARAEEQTYLLPKGAPGHAEGARLSIEVTREPLGGDEPWKRPLARVSDEAPRDAIMPGARVLPFPVGHDELEAAGWSDLIDEARSGIIGFAGGELRVTPTPAMTLIDIDGTLEAEALALAGAAAAARAIVRHGIGGSIGIDLPACRGKAERQAIAAAVDAILPASFERTAVNGFGFLQIVRPRRHASVFELAGERALFEARALLRRAARETGAIRLAVHPAVAAAIEARSDWLDALAAQVGGRVGLRSDPSLAMAAGYAERA